MLLLLYLLLNKTKKKGERCSLEQLPVTRCELGRDPPVFCLLFPLCSTCPTTRLNSGVATQSFSVVASDQRLQHFVFCFIFAFLLLFACSSWPVLSAVLHNYLLFLTYAFIYLFLMFCFVCAFASFCFFFVIFSFVALSPDFCSYSFCLAGVKCKSKYEVSLCLSPTPWRSFCGYRNTKHHPLTLLWVE